MSTDAETEHSHSAFKAWLIVLMLVVFILVKGGLAYFVIGDLGQPDRLRMCPASRHIPTIPACHFPSMFAAQRGSK